MKKIISLMLALVFIISLISVRSYGKEYFENSNLDIKIGKAYEENNPAKITSDKEIYLIDNNFNKLQNLNTKEIVATLKSGQLELKCNNFVFSKDFPVNGSLLLASEGFLKIKHEYRGYISFRINNGKLNIINNVNLEDYLKGVINNEMSGEYPLEALKAQAVCSRSFAISNYKKYIKKNYNLDDTTNSQVYRGKSSETENSNKAVEETKNMILLYNGKVADTIFGHSSGGFIADSKEVWGGEQISYLTSKEDPYSDYTWNIKYSLNDISNKIKEFNIGNVLDIKIESRDSSNRIKNISIIGENGTKLITGNTFRNILGNTKIKSTLFNISKSNDEINFSGKGYGHGVGLSQQGAVNMAKKNMKFNEILNFYFLGTVLKRG